MMIAAIVMSSFINDVTIGQQDTIVIAMDVQDVIELNTAITHL